MVLSDGLRDVSAGQPRVSSASAWAPYLQTAASAEAALYAIVWGRRRNDRRHRATRSRSYGGQLSPGPKNSRWSSLRKCRCATLLVPRRDSALARTCPLAQAEPSIHCATAWRYALRPTRHNTTDEAAPAVCTMEGLGGTRHCGCGGRRCAALRRGARCRNDGQPRPPRISRTDSLRGRHNFSPRLAGAGDRGGVGHPGWRRHEPEIPGSLRIAQLTGFDRRVGPGDCTIFQSCYWRWIRIGGGLGLEARSSSLLLEHAVVHPVQRNRRSHRNHPHRPEGSGRAVQIYFRPAVEAADPARHLSLPHHRAGDLASGGAWNASIVAEYQHLEGSDPYTTVGLGATILLRATRCRKLRSAPWLSDRCHGHRHRHTINRLVLAENVSPGRCPGTPLEV